VAGGGLDERSIESPGTVGSGGLLKSPYSQIDVFRSCGLLLQIIHAANVTFPHQKRARREPRRSQVMLIGFGEADGSWGSLPPGAQENELRESAELKVDPLS